MSVLPSQRGAPRTTSTGLPFKTKLFALDSSSALSAEPQKRNSAEPLPSPQLSKQRKISSSPPFS